MHWQDVPCGQALEELESSRYGVLGVSGRAELRRRGRKSDETAFPP